MGRNKSKLQGSTSTWRTYKRRRRTHVLELPSHVLELILGRLPLVDLMETTRVCSSWKSSAKPLLSRFLRAPWLFVPHKLPSTDFVGINNCFMKEEKSFVHGWNQATSDVFSKFPCIGSSHGWLIFLDFTAFSPFLLNPINDVRIHLPSMKSLFVKSKIARMNQRLHLQKQQSIGKAILTSEPIGEYCVVLICRLTICHLKLGLYKNGDGSWIELNGSYDDIIYCRNHLYALVLGWSASVDIWDLQTCPPIKCLTITPGEHPKKSLEEERSFGYLVESEGEILLVLRILLNQLYAGHDSVNRTQRFHVYKMDTGEKKWVEVESLGDRAVFVGVNHSVSISTKDLPNCKGNSIYFTGNYWLDVLWYGHDTGIYSLKDGNLESVLEFEPSCWIVPNHYWKYNA